VASGSIAIGGAINTMVVENHYESLPATRLMRQLLATGDGGSGAGRGRYFEKIILLDGAGIESNVSWEARQEP
jgi:hypothetical protein